MNDAELEKLLRSAPPPGRSPEFWEQLPRRISAKIHRQAQRASVPERTSLGWPSRLAWGVCAVTICLVIGFLAGPWHGSNQANGLLQNEKFVGEVLAMFPNQVQAIIQDENGLHLSLAERPDVPSSPPLWIKVCDGKHCRSFVTFSGQSVQLAGQRVEVLADARGGVLLVGERFVWSGAESVSPEHLRIRAEPLKELL